MACTPETKFDGFTQMLASGVSRRDALKWVGAATLGAMLTTAGIKQAEASDPRCEGSPDGCVGNPCNNCSSGLGCFCFAKVGKTKTKKCLQNAYCSGIQTCVTKSDCPSGSKCICQANGCGVSVCIKKCNACPTGASGGGGKTAA